MTPQLDQLITAKRSGDRTVDFFMGNVHLAMLVIKPHSVNEEEHLRKMQDNMATAVTTYLTTLEALEAACGWMCGGGKIPACEVKEILEAALKVAKKESPWATEVIDEMYQAAVDLYNDQGRISISMIQRNLRVGYVRASKLLDRLRKDGYND